MKAFSLSLAILGLLSLVLSQPITANAQSAKQQVRKLHKEIEQKHALIKQLSQKQVQLQGEIKHFDDKIDDKEVEVRSIEKQLKLTQTSLDGMQTDRKEIEQHLSGYRDALSGRMRAIYMMGDMTYLDLLFSAGNFSDFVDRLFYVQTICGHDEELIDKTQTDQQRLAPRRSPRSTPSWKRSSATAWRSARNSAS
jgi:peptidoglycan hydrolase CwlO-like protein